MWFLAQETGSTVGDFAGQIQGLLIATGIAGIVWFGLMILIFQRAAERRRRKAAGMEPLPAFYIQGYRWLRTQLQGPDSAATAPDIPMPPIDDLYAPIPDLDTLTQEIPPPFSLKPDDVVVEGEIEPPPAPQSQPAAKVTSPSLRVSALPDDAVEVMRVWRNINDGKLVVEMKGQYFGTASEIEGMGLSARFYSAVQEINALANIPAPAETPQSDTPAAAPEPEGMIGQIENFLQRKLTVKPEFANNNLHLRAAPHGGLMIQVNDQFYDGVDEIEDEAIRAFIQQTIQEWERQH